MEASKATISKQDGKSFDIKVASQASIDSKKCVNCGDCRTICPVGAIVERQRVICRLCPSCTDRPAMLPKEMEALATKEACTTACPLGISPQGYINLVAAGKEKEAYHHIWKHNPLPSICGRICHHPCEQVCKRGTLVDTPMAIRGIKRYLSDTYQNEMPDKYPVLYQEEIAVIGAGPAGLTAAHTLALSGYKVTVFDKEPTAGGMLNVGIPKFRLPREVTARDIQKLEQAGIKFEFGTRIGKAQLEDMKKSFDKIIVATGAPISKELTIEGWRKEGVITALHFMERVNQDQAVPHHPGQGFCQDGHAVVIGGGNVAIDCARTAVRLGAASVTMVCLESGEDVPCHPWDRKAAEDEGVIIEEGYAPEMFTGVFNELTGVKVNKVVNFKKQDNGAIHFDTDKDQSKVIPADWVVVAIGQAADSMWKKYTDDDAVMFAGDVCSNKCSVVDAMASGLQAAIAVDEALQGRSEKQKAGADRELHLAPVQEKIFPTTRRRIAKTELPEQDPDIRIRNFNEVEDGFDKAALEAELSRCLKCGYSSVDLDKCIGCGICKTVCPKGDVITMVSVAKGGK